MVIDTWEYGLLIFGGFIAGSINTLAGYGSVICLTLLMDVIGLPPLIANASNRLNVLSSGMIGSFVFYKKGKLNLKESKTIMTTIFLGALLGAYLSMIVSNETFKYIFKYLVILLFILLLINPKKWLRDSTEKWNSFPMWLLPLFFCIGMYGGFIQMGTGLFLLAALVLGAKQELIQANAFKVFVTAFYTLFILIAFIFSGLVAWKAGLALAIGSTIGGYLTSIYAVSFPSSRIYAYRLLIAIIIFIIIYQFNIILWLQGLF